MAQLYLDMDGVLADFDSTAEHILGMKPRKFEDTRGTKEFWDELSKHPEFYLNLELMPDAEKLFLNVIDLNPIILTGVPSSIPNAAPNKIYWAHKHFPGVRVITCVSRNKCLYCNPRDVLIDDWEKYKDLWEAKGGIFITHTDAESSLEKLKPYRQSLSKL